MSHAGDMRFMPIQSSPSNSRRLGLETLKHMVRVILDDVIVDVAAFRATLWSRLDEHVGHYPAFPPLPRAVNAATMEKVLKDQ
jgi:hypothetical protein